MGGVGIFLSGMAAGAFLGALTVVVIALAILIAPKIRAQVCRAR